MAEIVTSTGFDCPEPEPRMEVTSKELNIFVWTEYFPPEMMECFEMVYGIKVNRDEYSTNEEMYAKLSAGGTNYDLVQPTDYIVTLMIRQGLIQELDKGKLPNLINIDKGYLDLPFDPGNKYTVPYLAGTDAIVDNSDTVEPAPIPGLTCGNRNMPIAWSSSTTSRAVIGMTLLTLGFDPNTTDPAQLEKPR